MSQNVMPPENEEIVIGHDSGVTIGGNVVGNPDPNGSELINPSAIGPVTKFEMWHKVNNVPQLMSGVTGVRIPMGNTVLQIVKKTDGTSQWSIGGNVLQAYTDSAQRWWPASIKQAGFTTTNSQCSATRAADPLDRNAAWSAVTASDFVSFKIRTS